MAGVRPGSDLQPTVTSSRRMIQNPAKRFTLNFTVPDNKDMSDNPNEYEFYCPRCAKPVFDPLVCGDCSALICRQCGAPLERVDELGIG